MSNKFWMWYFTAPRFKQIVGMKFFIMPLWYASTFFGNQTRSLNVLVIEAKILIFSDIFQVKLHYVDYRKDSTRRIIHHRASDCCTWNTNKKIVQIAIFWIIFVTGIWIRKKYFPSVFQPKIANQKV